MYRYRCDQCRTTSPTVRTEVEMHAARDEHRRRMHGGHVPDGEHLLRFRPRPTRGDLRPATAVIILAALLLLAWLTR